MRTAHENACNLSDVDKMWTDVDCVRKRLRLFQYGLEWTFSKLQRDACRCQSCGCRACTWHLLFTPMLLISLLFQLSSEWEQVAAMELERGRLSQEVAQARREKSEEATELASIQASCAAERDRLAEARREMSRLPVQRAADEGDAGELSQRLAILVGRVETEKGRISELIAAKEKIMEEIEQMKKTKHEVNFVVLIT